MNQIIVALAFLVGVPVFVAVVATINGWVLSILWGWFIVPLGAMALSVPAAIGVALVVSFLTHQYRSKANDDPDWGALIWLLCGPPVTLFVGWVVKTFFL